MKKLLAILITTVFLLTVTKIPVMAIGDGNIDGGGGGTGSGDKNNFWSVGNDGVRVTVINDDTKQPHKTPVDYTNKKQPANIIHFSKKSKIQYRSGTTIKKYVQEYKYANPKTKLPTIITANGVSNIANIKKYFTDKYTVQMIAQDVGMSYSTLINGTYKLLLEPIAYVTFEGLQYAMTATEAALYDQIVGGKLYQKLTSVTHQNLPLSMFLEISDLGFPKWTGATSGYRKNAEIISSLGLGIVKFKEKPVEPTKAQRYDYAVDSISILTNPIREENPFEVTATFSFIAVNKGHWIDGAPEWQHNPDGTGQMVPGPDEWVPPRRPEGGNALAEFLINVQIQNEASSNISFNVDNENDDRAPNGAGWSISGTASITTMLNAGENIGNKTVEARINWQGRTLETNSNNNNRQTNINVIPATNLTVDFLTPNAPYRTNTEVITTVLISNQDNIGEINIRPKHRLNAILTVKNPNGGTITTVETVPIVIPKQGENIAYFKWKLPVDYTYDSVNMRVDINTKKTVKEMDYSDNFATMTHKTMKYIMMETPDTKFEDTPSWFKKPTNSNKVDTSIFADDVKNEVSFEEWIWENDWYNKKNYSIKLTTNTELIPDIKNPSKKKDSKGNWITRSGYGLELKITTDITGNLPTSKGYTLAQNGTAYFSEWRFKGGANEYRTLEKTSDKKFEFQQNKYAMDEKGKSENRRVHFTPLWYPDGEYQVRSYIFDVWTPVGMISSLKKESVIIDGDIYDDWVVTHGEQNG